MLIGRSGEIAMIDALIESARHGRSASVVLEGAAGIGKTALLEEVARSTDSFGVAWVRGFESESALGFGALHRLLLPLDRGRAGLVAAQRAALDAAFGSTKGARADQFVVGLATLAVLESAARDRPLLCVVDDAQWIDAETISVLGFVARRLFSEGVVLVFLLQPSTEPIIDLQELRRETIGGLPAHDSRQLLEALAVPPLDNHVVRHLVAAAGGNPLFLKELAETLSAEQLSGSSPLPEPLPFGREQGLRIWGQFEALPRRTRDLLLLAAAEPSMDLARLWRVAGTVGLSADDALPAEQVGLWSVTSRSGVLNTVRLAAIYSVASIDDRRRAHATLAASMAVVDLLDRRAWHLAASVEGPSEVVAVELERSAHRARSRGGFSAQAAALARAADLTPDVNDRAGRLLDAALAAEAAGRSQWAASLVEQALPLTSDPLLTARAERLAGLIRWPRPSLAELPSVLLSAARRLFPLDVRAARDSLLEAMGAAILVDPAITGDDLDVIARAVRAAPPAERVTIADALLEAYSTWIMDSYVIAAPQFRAALDSMIGFELTHDDASTKCYLAVMAAYALWDFETLGVWLQRILEWGRALGAMPLLRLALSSLSAAAVLRGDAALARDLHSELQEIGVAMGSGDSQVDVADLVLAAWNGDTATTVALADLVIAENLPRGATSIVNAAKRALLTLHLGNASYDDAASLARDFIHDDPLVFGTETLPDSIEALLRSGDRDMAVVAIGRLRERAYASGSPWALGLLTRSAALTAGEHLADDLYRESIDHLSMAGVRMDLGRARLLYGEWLRRQKRRVDAREQLRQAHEAFVQCGADAFARRALAELEATGERARRRSVETRNDLTPQERRIASLAASGSTNVEIAARLFVSTSTVDYHLHRVFQKLAITSRRELAGALG